MTVSLLRNIVAQQALVEVSSPGDVSLDDVFKIDEEYVIARSVPTSGGKLLLGRGAFGSARADHSIGTELEPSGVASGAGTLAATLALGNDTGGVDIVSNTVNTHASVRAEAIATGSGNANADRMAEADGNGSANTQSYAQTGGSGIAIASVAADALGDGDAWVNISATASGNGDANAFTAAEANGTGSVDVTRSATANGNLADASTTVSTLGFGDARARIDAGVTSGNGDADAGVSATTVDGIAGVGRASLATGDGGANADTLAETQGVGFADARVTAVAVDGDAEASSRATASGAGGAFATSEATSEGIGQADAGNIAVANGSGAAFAQNFASTVNGTGHAYANATATAAGGNVDAYSDATTTGAGVANAYINAVSEDGDADATSTANAQGSGDTNASSYAIAEGTGNANASSTATSVDQGIATALVTAIAGGALGVATARIRATHDADEAYVEVFADDNNVQVRIKAEGSTGQAGEALIATGGGTAYWSRRTIYGTINGPDGATIAGTGFSAARTGLGQWTVTFTDAFAVAPIVIVSLAQAPTSPCVPCALNVVGASFDVEVIQPGTARYDFDFSFTAMAL